MTRDPTAGALQTWRSELTSQRRRGRPRAERIGLLRFAFYGRLSTKEHQHAETSWQWQLSCATDLIDGFGTIVAYFFDVGMTRRRAWAHRPQAARLLTAVAAGAGGFDAVVVGEYERAFSGRQVFHIAALLAEHGIGLWLPELLGPVDLQDPAHRAVLIEIGARSLREVQRSRHRAIEAMRVQTRYQGRYLGGRPPYGYRLIGVGPHPNTAHAGWGRQLLRLDPDPATAGHVRWIFAQRLLGRSMAGIARDLNDRDVPCPSINDRARNRHRHATGWNVSTIKAILGNPRYTGWQVWNRQSSRYRDNAAESEPSSVALQRGHNERSDWEFSDKPAHPALVSETDFVAAQHISALATPATGPARPYLLVGLLRCATCDRRLISHWTHDRAWYRCRHGQTHARPSAFGQPRTLYLREDRTLDAIQNALRSDASLGYTGGSDVARYLRENDLTALCDWTTITLDRTSTRP